VNAVPDVFKIENVEDLDFIILGCDGIFDVMSNEECCEVVWETVELFRFR
jgi:serine/threonine protein phosphatase PrpC